MQLQQLASVQADPKTAKGEDQDKKNQDNFNNLIQFALTARNANRWSDADQAFPFGAATQAR